MKKTLLLLFLILNIKFVFANDLKFSNRILAVVDKDIILNSDLNTSTKIEKLENFLLFDNNIEKFKFKNLILNKLINDKLFLIFFKKINNINIKKYKIDKYIKKISKNSLLNKDEFINYLKNNNISINDYINFIKKKILIKKIIKKYIVSLLNVSEKEINYYKNNLKIYDKIKNIFLLYNISIIKIFNKSKINNININNFKNYINNIIKKKINVNENTKIIDNYNKNKIEINNKNNILYKNLPNLIKLNLVNNNNDNFIGPIYISNFAYFVKINSIKEINYNKSIKVLNIYKICNTNINNKNNKNKNLSDLIKINNKNINNKLNNIKIKDLGWKNIKNKSFKKILKNLEINNFSKPFEYKNKWNILYFKNYKNIKYKDYIENKIFNKLILNDKSLFIINKIVDNFKKNIYVEIFN